MTLAVATEVTDDLRSAWTLALEGLSATRGGPELLADVLGEGPDPLVDLVARGEVRVERRGGELAGFAVVRGSTILGVFVAPAHRGRGVARAMAAALFAGAAPPRDALALPGDRATKSLYESLGLKARLLTMRAE